MPTPTRHRCLRLTRPALAAALACSTLLPALAQTNVQRVEVIAATPLPGAELPRDLVAGQVQTVSAADLDRSHAGDLSAHLQRRLGSVHVNDIQGNALQADLNYRGFTASPLLGTAQGLSVYFDGVRLNQPFGDVVSWDLIPRIAIQSVNLMPGSNPLFGLNALGGAITVQTKDGVRAPGISAELTLGQHGLRGVDLEAGGGRRSQNWYLAARHQVDDGWRDASPSRVSQLFGKLAFQSGGTHYTLSAAAAQTLLTGNGLQEMRLLQADRNSVYTTPDTTRNRAGLLNLAFDHAVAPGVRFSGNAYLRDLRTRAVNGDVNEDSLDQSVYQPNAAERAALAAAGYSGYPASGESAANTAFPKWRCIAQALLADEPGEKCNGLITSSRTEQRQSGLQWQFSGQQGRAPFEHRWLAGAALDRSRVHFRQNAELGYLNADRSVTGVGAFADGVTGGNVDGTPLDTRVDLTAHTRTASVFTSDTVGVGPGTHVTASARWNRVTVRNRDAIQPGGGTGSLDGDHVFQRVNPALGLTSSTPGGSATLYLGWGQASRAPTAVELGCADPDSPCKLPNSMAGDPALRQVVTTTLEGGLRGGNAATRWNIGLFRADNRDDILFVADNAAGFGYFRNVGKTRRQGLEAGFETRLAGSRLALNYTWLDATFRTAEVLNGSANSRNDQAVAGLPGVDGTLEVRPGDRLPLIPRHLLKLSGEWPVLAGVSLSADLQAVGGSFARGNENNAHQPDGSTYLGPGRSGGYAVMNLGLDWRPAAGVTLWLQVANLFDRQYATASQLGAAAFDAQGRFVARPFAANANGDRPLVQSTFYAPGAPRSVSVGVRLHF